MRVPLANVSVIWSLTGPQVSLKLEVVLRHPAVSFHEPTGFPPHGVVFEHAAFPPFPELEHPASAKSETAAITKMDIFMVAQSR
jgi:hypothetical protein